MAKIYNVLRYVDDIKPNRFTDDTKVQWLNEVEGYIQTEVMMLALSEVVQYDPEAHMHTELLVKPPHDKLYAMYLCAMVDFANGEYDKYENTMQMYNEFLGEYIKWYTMHYRPADGGCVDEGYYLTAYQLAVIRGFEGSVDEWLESLRGKTAYEQAVEQGYRGTPEEFGRDQAGFAENAQTVRILREQAAAAASDAEGFANSAEKNAEAAKGSAEQASKYKDAAETAATEAAKSASDAKESAQNAVREVSTAADQALRDIESAGNEKIGEIESAADAEISDITAAGTGQIQRIETAAEEEMQTVRSEGEAQVGAIRGSVEELMERAETAAGTAESSASSASSASMSAMGYSDQASRHSATASVYAGKATTSASNAETAANNATASKDAAETASAEAKSAAERVKEALGLYPTITLTPLTVAPGMPNAFLVTVKNADGTIQSETVENGVNGITPNIGPNGNWWIGGADTGVLARGVAPTISVERDDNEGRVDIFVEDGKGGAMFAWVKDGKPGVHVGSDAPPAGTRVWVNPDGKATKIPKVDETLSKAGYAADAAAVGEKLNQQSDAIADKLDANKLPEAINTALEQAKASGEFDGKPGAPGNDYVLTEADKREIAELVGVSDAGEYRLLKTITVSEATQRISETWGGLGDGKGYDGAVVVFDDITGIENTNGLTMYAAIGSLETVIGVGAALKNGTAMRLVARKLNGLWDVFGSYGEKEGASTLLGQTGCARLYSTAPHNATPDGYRFSWDKISYALFYTFAESLPIGMTIKIFVLGGEENA